MPMMNAAAFLSYAQKKVDAEIPDNKHMVGKREQEVILLQHTDHDIGIYACYIPFPLGNDN